MADYSFEKAHEILRDRRYTAEKEALERKLDLMNKEPEYAQIETALLEAGRDSLTAAMTRDKRKKDELKKKIADLSKREVSFLESKGYGKDYLQPDYYCRKCCDKGMVGPEGAQVRCSCYKQLILDCWREESGLSSAGFDFTKFDDSLFSDDIDKEKYGITVSPRKNAEDNLKICRDFCDGFSSDQPDLLFFGPAGSGKTFTCSCMATELIKKDIPVMYITAYKLFSSVLSFGAFDEGREKARITEELLRKTSVLIIDDLGSENTSEARKSLLLDVLNERESNNMSFPCKTVISSNLSVSDLYSYYGERIGSRIVGRFKILHFAGDDIRLKKAKEKLTSQK